MGKKKNDFFWISYSDLMTSLFFIMLILFVLVYSIMKCQHYIIIEYQKERKKIEEIKAAIKNLDPEYFKYDSINKYHEFQTNIEFTSKKHDIPKKYYGILKEAGKALEKVLNDSTNKEFDIKYIVIIEGMAARYTDPLKYKKHFTPKNINYTYKLSYDRAKEVYQFWVNNGIKFNEKIVEIIIAGSGWFGAGRYTGKDEGKNKRILIQIIPKIGTIDYRKTDNNKFDACLKIMNKYLKTNIF